jgi:DHA1 family bicyclomycin/chloramphenicol resistance-like MFS transporter
MVLVTIILMDLLVGIEFDLFVPSFPELQSHFTLSPFWVEALLSINFIGYCIGIFFAGTLADRYGRKKVLLLGLLTFVMGSTLCLGNPSYNSLLIGRFFQGVGIASPSVLSFLIIADFYPVSKQQYYMAMLNGLKNAAVAAAPVMGSYIALYFQWQGNFTVLLLLGLAALAMTLLFIPNYKLPEHKETISLSGYIPLFSSKPLVLLIANLTFIFVPYWIFVGMSPLLYMEDLGVSLKHFGYYQGVMALFFALGSVCYGLVIQKFDQTKMLKISNQIFIASAILIAMIAYLDIPNPLLITSAIVLFVIGQIIPTTILYPICMNFIPQAKGKVTALVQGASLILSSLGLQLAGYLYAGSFQNIGIIICAIIVLASITLYYVMQGNVDGKITPYPLQSEV